MKLNRFTSAVWDGFKTKTKKGEDIRPVGFFSRCIEPLFTDALHLLMFRFCVIVFLIYFLTWFSYICIALLFKLQSALRLFWIFLNMFLFLWIFVALLLFFVCFPFCWFALYGEMYSNLNEGLVQCYAPFFPFHLRERQTSAMLPARASLQPGLSYTAARRAEKLSLVCLEKSDFIFRSRWMLTVYWCNRTTENSILYIQNNEMESYWRWSLAFGVGHMIYPLITP